MTLHAVNKHGTPITAMVCSSCRQLFTVTGTHSVEAWGSGCLSVGCDSYDVSRDVDLMFEIEPWRIREDTQE